jgi:predicted  nucleic acid-binding Zn-ribbon protein
VSTDLQGKVQDVKDKATETKNSVTDKVKEQTQNQSKTLDDARQQLTTYGNQIQEYLGKIDAKVETYRFSVEKIENGLLVDIAFKATMQSPGSTKDETSK